MSTFCGERAAQGRGKGSLYPKSRGLFFYANKTLRQWSYQILTWHHALCKPSYQNRFCFPFHVNEGSEYCLLIGYTHMQI